jgi:GntR family transcriptional regulator, transcriptional repressor for pyruvate dehydrogenase complex
MLSDLTVYKRLYTAQPRALAARAGHQTELIAALEAGDADDARRVMTSHMEMARA